MVADKSQKLNAKPIKSNPADFWVETDAPLQGWGARFEKKMKEGRWTHEEGVLHITYNISFWQYVLH